MGYGSFAGATFGPAMDVQAGGSTTFYLRKNASAGNITGADMTAFSQMDFTLALPIAEWAGNGTVNLGAGSVEYAFNTSGITTAGASDTTAFGYGPAGAAIGSIASTTVGSDTNFQCRFQYPIQNDDLIILETDAGTSGARWVAMDSVLGRFSQSTSRYGCSVSLTNTTDVTISFGNKGFTASNAIYAGDGSAWSILAAWRWRVRKAKAGAAVGFGMAGTDGSAGLYKAGQAPGSTSGAAIPAGYVGQAVALAYSGVTITLSGTWYANITPMATLTAGVWLISVSLVPGTVSTLYAGNISTLTTAGSGHLLPGNIAGAPIASLIGSFSAQSIVYTATGSTPIYAHGYSTSSGTSCSLVGTAVRIA
jgi:hypothetical protein